ncbi:MAG: asparagine synthase (glutamine-hydrolyzing) [Flavobacteriales bacterium]|nr:asparagine synthase (glutamine-hydrolyzing) [Flavobacteriales bacterium]
MCGILFCKSLKITSECFKNASRMMSHRGPDNLGYYSFNEIKMSHNRLSIIDLDKRSNQPFKIGNFYIVFNGEIYNYKELIKEHHLIVKTESDTEVLLKMYIKYGSKCLKFLNGMFSFIIFNETTEDIFVARDRLGIKPLYFYQKGEEIIFSSEISPIRSLKDVQVSEFSIRQYSKFRMTVNGDTLFDDVKFFPAGSYMESGKITKYWDLEICEKPDPKDDDELDELIRQSINLRMRSDVPVSSYLSGGLDSTIITAIARPKTSWTIGFDNLNEFEWSKLAGEDLKIGFNQLCVTNKDFIKTADWMIKKRQEPLSVPNEVLIYIMTKKARESGYKVILSGEGADELFWGYDRIFRWANEQKELTVEGFENKYCYGSKRDLDIVDYALSCLPKGSPVEKVGYYFQITHLHGLLRRVDNSTMLCSVEARVPFVDHNLVEYMNGRSFNYRMGSSFKEPLKRIFKNEIPKAIIDRPKIGFPVPLNSIFNTGELKTGFDEWFKFNLERI